MSLLKRIPTAVSNGFDSSPEQINLSTSSPSILEQDFQELSVAEKMSSEHILAAKITGDHVLAAKMTGEHVLAAKMTSDHAAKMTGDHLLTAKMTSDHVLAAISNGVDPCPNGGEEGDADMACGVTPDGVDVPKIDGNVINDLSNDEVLSHLLRTIHPEQISRLETLLNRLPDCNFTK